MNNRDVLGVSKNASKSEIKKAFRDAAKEFHPDLSDSPEAAEAFKRIKEAHDALMQDTAGIPQESATVTTTAAHAAAATAQAAYAKPDPEPAMTEEELRHIQELDKQATRILKKRHFFRRTRGSAEVRRHLRKIKTTEDRITGKY